jgi:predicted protein tyrosine phosphatase
MKTVTWLSKDWMTRDKRKAAIISIGDPGEEMPSFAVEPIDVLRIECHDIPDGVAIEDLDSTYRQFDWTHARKILQFEHRFRDHDIIVHCHAGISRSAAVANYLGTRCKRFIDLSSPCSGSLLKMNKQVYRQLEITHMDLQMSGGQVTPLEGLKR